MTQFEAMAAITIWRSAAKIAQVRMPVPSTYSDRTVVSKRG
jgi:hypothetical protein